MSPNNHSNFKHNPELGAMIKAEKQHEKRRRSLLITGIAALALVLVIVVLLLFWPSPAAAPASSSVSAGASSAPVPSSAVSSSLPASSVTGFAPYTSARLKAAHEENPDVVGWLTLPGCEIDERVFQAADNDYYLRRNEAGEYDVWGCYFLDYINVIDRNIAFTDPVNIIYGHSLEDVTESQRFSKLKRYKSPDFAAQNPTITFSLLERELTFEVFSACNIPISIDYIDPRPDTAKYQATLDYMLKNSFVDFDVPVTTGDQILILSTCTSDENVRFIVAARLVTQ